jgi:dihydrodipicolinate reductase
VKVTLFGRGGKVGSVLAPALERTGHTLVELGEADAMVDFTAPDAVGANVQAAGIQPPREPWPPSEGWRCSSCRTSPSGRS